jgi:hypothetical protein
MSEHRRLVLRIKGNPAQKAAQLRSLSTGFRLAETAQIKCAPLPSADKQNQGTAPYIGHCAELELLLGELLPYLLLMNDEQ